MQLTAETALALAIEACPSAPVENRREWWDQVVALAAEIPGAMSRIDEALRNAPLHQVALCGTIERVEQMVLPDGKVGRGAVWFRPERPGKFGAAVERYTTEWLSHKEGRAVFDAAAGAVGRQVQIIRARVPKYAGGQRVVDADGNPATTSRLVAVEVIDGAQDNGPEDAVPEDAVPEDAVPEDAVPEDAVPEDNGAQDAVQEDAVQESTVSSVWVASIRRGLHQAGIAEDAFLPVLHRTLGRSARLEDVRLSEAHMVVALVKRHQQDRSQAH
ncbi:MAG: hypothetical protein ACYCS4_07795 [Acidimicrobiales bacterium]